PPPRPLREADSSQRAHSQGVQRPSLWPVSQGDRLAVHEDQGKPLPTCRRAPVRSPDRGDAWTSHRPDRRCDSRHTGLRPTFTAAGGGLLVGGERMTLDNTDSRRRKNASYDDLREAGFTSRAVAMARKSSPAWLAARGSARARIQSWRAGDVTGRTYAPADTP